MAPRHEDADAPSELVTLDLDVRGMTCTACAARIERKLNRTEGVESNVNYALGRASVRFDPTRIGPDEIVRTVEGVGYGASAQRSSNDVADGLDARSLQEATRLRNLRRRLAIGAPLALFAALVSMLASLQFDWWIWPVACASTAVVLYSGWPFHAASLKNLRHATATMDTLVTLGTAAALAWSWWAITFGGGGARDMRMRWHWTLGSGVAAGAADPAMAGMDMGTATRVLAEPYFEVSAVVIVFLLLGKLLEARATHSAGSALRSLATLSVKEVEVLAADGTPSAVPLAELLPGQRFLVRPGGRVATDGVVVEGCSAIDASMVTGESVPVDVTPGARVTGGTLNTSGALTVRALRVGRDTQLAQITTLVEQAQTRKAAVQRLADKVAAVFVPAVITLALATLAFWLLSGWPTGRAVAASVSVLIIACPCALGLATPTALLVGTTRGAQLGLLVSGPQALEASERIDTVVFDKTGTITTGKMRLIDVGIEARGTEDLAGDVARRSDSGLTPLDLLLLGAGAESGSEHPVARAIRDGAESWLAATPPLPSRYPSIPASSRFASEGGLGVLASVDGHEIKVGRRSWIDPSQADRAGTNGGTEVSVGIDGVLVGHIEVGDRPKPESRATVAALHADGLATLLLTGDNPDVARRIADEVGIDDVIAGVLPSAKLEVIDRLRAEGRRVAMVGDGVNDAAALAGADLGIAMATGTDVARAAADITVLGGDISRVPTGLRLARATMRTIKGNLFWAFAYNVAALPLAASGRLNPMVAGAAMSMSSVFVVTNSLRLRRFR